MFSKRLKEIFRKDVTYNNIHPPSEKCIFGKTIRVDPPKNF